MGRAILLATLGMVLVACAGSSRETGDGGTAGTSADAGTSANAGAPATIPAPPRCEEYYSCCDLDDGTIEEAGCDADGFRLPCAANSFHWTAQAQALCKPDGVEASDCDDLDGLTCEPGQECHKYGACSTHCTCEVMGAGYGFRCLANAC
jgi:hypothetical protein